MRFLHCSDIHLGRRPAGPSSEFTRKRFDDYFTSFEKIIDNAILNKVDAIVIAGDLFDKKELSPDVLARTELLFQKLKENNIPAIVIEGNHDNVTRGMEQDSWLIYLENKEYIIRPTYQFTENGYIFSPFKIGDVNFYGLGYPGSFINETLEALAKHIEETQDNNNVILVHTAITGSNLFPGTADKAYIDLLKDKCIYIAGGHYHYHHSYPSGEPFFFVPGSGEYWDHTEFEQTKGYIIFDTESKTHQFFKSELRNVINLNIIHKEDSPTITVLIEQVLSDYAISNEDIINLKIQLSGNALYERNDIEDLLENYNPLKYYIKVENKDYISSSDFTDTALSTDAIEQEILSGWDYFSNDSVKAQYVLDKLKKYQEDNREDDFVELFDSLLDELIEGGINADS